MNKKINEKQEFSSEEIKEMYKKAKEEVGGYGLKTFERALEIYQEKGEISDEELDQVAGGINRKTLSLALAGVAAIAAGFGVAGSQQAFASDTDPKYSTERGMEGEEDLESGEIPDFVLGEDSSDHGDHEGDSSRAVKEDAAPVPSTLLGYTIILPAISNSSKITANKHI